MLQTHSQTTSTDPATRIATATAPNHPKPHRSHPTDRHADPTAAVMKDIFGETPQDQPTPMIPPTNYFPLHRVVNRDTAHRTQKRCQFQPNPRDTADDIGRQGCPPNRLPLMAASETVGIPRMEATAGRAHPLRTRSAGGGSQGGEIMAMGFRRSRGHGMMGRGMRRVLAV